MEISLLKIDLENKVDASKADEIEKRLANYALRREIIEIQEDIQDFIKKEEMNIVVRDLEYLRKDLGKFSSKEELLTRMNVFNSDVNTKL